MKSILIYLNLMLICCLITNCTRLKHATYFQESKFPDSLETVQLKIITDSTGEVITSRGSNKFKLHKIGRHYYKIDSNLGLIDSSLRYLTTDTLVAYQSKIFFFTDDVKLVFNRKIASKWFTTPLVQLPTALLDEPRPRLSTSN